MTRARLETIKHYASMGFSVGESIVSWLGVVLIAFIGGASVYAAWIRPEVDLNDLINGVIGSLPKWVMLVALLMSLRMLVGLIVLNFVRVYPPVLGIFLAVRWLCRRVRGNNNR